MRISTKFICQQCSYQSSSFLGRCPNCGSWNSLVETLEEVRSKKSEVRSKKQGKVAKPLRISEIKIEHMARISTGMEEFDRVLGGGILKGAVTLLSGDPGIGKSTLLLQIALNLSQNKSVVLSEAASDAAKSKDPRTKQEAKKEILRSAQNDNPTILYVSGEESVEQIKMRVNRLSKLTKQEVLNNFFLLAETQVDAVINTIEKLSPDLIVIDSIQTMETDELSGMAGSVGQVRESAARLLSVAKDKQIPLFLVGHVTKEGAIAGPQVLSHMVDTVLFLEGERYQSLRLLRGLKNRFGPVDEVGIFEMTEKGFMEVVDPNRFFLSAKNKLPGKSVVLTLEGTRPLLCEIQALVVPTKLSFPKRVVSGLDSRRVELMIAVLQKTLHLPLERFDVFVSTSSGLRIFEPGLDLGICLAIISSFKNKPVSSHVVAISEVSLLGELKTASQMDRRLKEAKRLGFSKIAWADTFETLNEVVRKVFV